MFLVSGSADHHWGAGTKYPVVRFVGQRLGMEVCSDSEDEAFDLFWTDSAVGPEQVSLLETHQKINHFPGMYAIHRKDNLARNLMQMQRKFPEFYNYFPLTWLLPSGMADFSRQFDDKKQKTFILKPEASCQGRGIVLVRSPEDVPQGEHYVAQKYLGRPLLIDGLKFDLRLYALVAGCDPLRIYLHKDGMGRFATQPYKAPNAKNLKDMCMHLTNYAVNKASPLFVFNATAAEANVGHKRSLAAMLQVSLLFRSLFLASGNRASRKWATTQTKCGRRSRG
jgi:tubulin polyglutamylase TTLL6/13